MTPKIKLTTPYFTPSGLGLSLLIGASIALLLISVMLLGVKDANPVWGKSWMIRPLVMVTMAGAMGGLCFHLLGSWGRQGGWKKVLAVILGILVYLVGVWMGVVLGLNGTLWN